MCGSMEIGSNVYGCVVSRNESQHFVMHRFPSMAHTGVCSSDIQDF